VACARRSRKARGVEAISHQADLTAVSEIARLVDTTIERFGRWDILVNTAGLIVRKPLAETTEEEYDNSFAINTKIPFFLMAQAYSKMADNVAPPGLCPVVSRVAFPAGSPRVLRDQFLFDEFVELVQVDVTEDW
jgi:NAD(P)-dependent dehydrogenase (short-subunit alcohol dehydrogenase family)